MKKNRSPRTPQFKNTADLTGCDKMVEEGSYLSLQKDMVMKEGAC